MITLPEIKLNTTPNPLLVPASGSVEQQLTGLPHLQRDMKHLRRHRKLDLVDARQAKDAAESLGRIPDEGESLHMVISGRFALWDFVPAMLTLSGTTITAMHIATLGFSKRNIAKMCELHDAGRIGSIHLLCSHYFAGTSGAIYDFAVEQFATRSGCKFLSVRTHAKMVLVAFADGRKIVIESSANLRSCKNIEQVSIFADGALYAFHRGWIEGLFMEAANGD